MNRVQKAAFAASALAITLIGAAFVTAPMAFAGSKPLVAHHYAYSAHAAVSAPAPAAGALQ